MTKEDRKRIVVIGVDPAFRAYGTAASFLSLKKREVEFKNYKTPILFQNNIEERLGEYKEEGLFPIVGIENSYLTKLLWQGLRPKQIYTVGMNRATSQLMTLWLKDKIGENRVFEYIPRKLGKKATGGKKPDRYFKATVRTMGLTLVNYPEVPKAKDLQTTKTIDQDYRDAFYLAEKAFRDYKNSPLRG